jgi:menaquinol-cytochrome c reductase iron-sulfur subunit
MNEHSEPQNDVETGSEPRRGFLVKAAAVLVGGIATLVPLVSAVLLFLNPLAKRKTDEDDETDDGFVRIGTTGSLVPAGPPQLFKVSGIKVDAWTTYPEAALGAVYVRMLEDGSVEAYNARCPHLGCTVQFQTAVGEYVCPCHGQFLQPRRAAEQPDPPPEPGPPRRRGPQRTGTLGPVPEFPRRHRRAHPGLTRPPVRFIVSQCGSAKR